MGVVGDGVNSAGNAAVAVSHSVENAFRRIKNGLTKLRLEAVEQSPVPISKKQPTA